MKEEIASSSSDCAFRIEVDCHSPKPRLSGPSYHPLWRQISGQRVNDPGNAHTPAICLETSWTTRHSTTEGYREVGKQLGKTVAAYLSGK
jgi:hypothetical protein